MGGRELGGQLGRVAVPGRPVGPFQPLASGGVQPRPAAGRDPVVQHRPVEVVVEPEPRRHRPVRPGHRAGGPQEAALAGQRRAALLDRLDVGGPVSGGRGGGELDPGDGGRLQHGQVGGVQPLQLELEQAAEVVRDLALAAAGPGRQLPAPAAGRRTPASVQARASCTTNSGTPSVRRCTSRASSSGTSAPGRPRPSTVATAGTPSSPSRSSEARPRSRRPAPVSAIGAAPARASAGR